MIGFKAPNKSPVVHSHNDEYDELYCSVEHINEIRGLARHGRRYAQMNVFNEENNKSPLRSLQRFTRYFRRNMPKNILPEPRRGNNWPLLNFAVRTYTNLALTFLFDSSMLIFSPVNALLFLTVYPFMILLLITVEVSLKIFLDYLGGQELVTYLSVRYGGGNDIQRVRHLMIHWVI